MKDKKKTLRKKDENLKYKKMLKKQRIQEKGITLIALVVTIVILLILAGVTLNIALSDNGLFNKTKKAADDYKEAQDREAEEIDKLDYTFQDTQDELAGKLVLNGKYSEKNKVNMPNLSHTGLTAVKFDGVSTVALQSDDGTDIIKNVTDDDIQNENWYSYGGEEGKNNWANAKSTDGSLWVWIPRFAYKITQPTSGGSSGKIDIVFLKGTTDEPADSSVSKDQIVRATAESTDGKYIVHPAFTNESNNEYANGGWDAEIPGFWMAKFEAGFSSEPVDSSVKYSTTYGWNGSANTEITTNYYGDMSVGTKIKYPTFQANKPSMNYIGISDAYQLCKEMNKTGNPYDFNSSKVDSHLTKNSEWGAVAYLSYSKYGRNGSEITQNTKNTNGINTVWAMTGYTSDNQAWTTGESASTTGNISGIYDMSGGLWELTSGYISVKNDNYNKYAGKLREENNGNSNKYKSKYEINEENTKNNYDVEKNKKRLGEAIWETSTAGTDNTSWMEDNSIFINDESSFTCRGGAWYTDVKKSGIFSFSANGGNIGNHVGFRAVLICE